MANQFGLCMPFVVLLVATQCSLTKPIPAARAPERAVLVACQAARAKAAALLSTESLNGCLQHSDCREVSRWVSGKCGVVANQMAFESRSEELQEATACDELLQLDEPTCPLVQPVCVSGHCTSEARSELVDECEERKARIQAFGAGDKACEQDADCTLVDGSAVHRAFADQLAREHHDVTHSCGSALPLLGAAPSMLRVACVERTCRIDLRNEVARPKADVKCLAAQLFKAHPGRTSDAWAIKARVSQSGSLNHFRFIKPDDLSVEAKAEIVTRLSSCRVEPARLGAEPIAIDYVFNVEFKFR